MTGQAAPRCGDDHDHPGEDDWRRPVSQKDAPECKAPATHACDVFDVYTCDEHAKKCPYCEPLGSEAK